MAAGSLQASDLRVTLSRFEILRGIELTAKPGEVISVLGPSGAGKSTLFRAIAGEVPLQAGRLTLLARDVGKWPLWRRARLGLGYLPQVPSVLWDLSVRDNLRTFSGISRAFASGRELEALTEELGLGERLATRARLLSGGERRRLELIRVLLGRPKVLLCDEPFTGLDAALATVAARLLRERADAGATVLLADHRVDLCLGISDRAVLLADGRLAIESTPDAFRAHPAVQHRYLGGDS